MALAVRPSLTFSLIPAWRTSSVHQPTLEYALRPSRSRAPTLRYLLPCRSTRRVLPEQKLPTRSTAGRPRPVYKTPQDLVISGLNKTVYVADCAARVVYSTAGLGGSTLTPVSTGAITLSAPRGLALDGAGNLFIADYDTAQLVEVPTTTGLPPSVVNTGGLLQHPICVAFDSQGNTYIGDAGPAGYGASFADPGYIVKIPVGGSPFKMTIPSVQIFFPQILARSHYRRTGDRRWWRLRWWRPGSPGLRRRDHRECHPDRRFNQPERTRF